LIVPPLEEYCSRVRDKKEEVCGKMIHALVSDMLLGLIDHTTVPDVNVREKASKGLLHAVAVASKLSRGSGKYAVVSVTDDLFNGVVVISGPGKTGVSTCSVRFGILQVCDDPSVLGYWPQNGRKTTIVLITPEALKKRVEQLLALRQGRRA